MIASVSGKVLATTLGTVMVEVGGVGLLLHASNRTAASVNVGQQTSLLTVLIVREDSLTLYGFLESMELDTFDLLRSVNGVGPKSALSILSALSVQEIADAVASESDIVFKSVPGVGVKTAKLITVSLSGKLPWGAGSANSSTTSRPTIDALVGLGYSEKEASKAVANVSSENLSSQDILKLALQSLAKGGTK